MRFMEPVPSRRLLISSFKYLIISLIIFHLKTVFISIALRNLSWTQSGKHTQMKTNKTSRSIRTNVMAPYKTRKATRVVRIRALCLTEFRGCRCVYESSLIRNHLTNHLWFGSINIRTHMSSKTVRFTGMFVSHATVFDPFCPITHSFTERSINEAHCLS